MPVITVPVIIVGIGLIFFTGDDARILNAEGAGEQADDGRGDEKADNREHHRAVERHVFFGRNECFGTELARIGSGMCIGFRRDLFRVFITGGEGRRGIDGTGCEPAEHETKDDGRSLAGHARHPFCAGAFHKRVM